MQLTKNFTINEMVYSVTAAYKKIDNRPSVPVIENLRQLCINVLQPLREHLGCAVKVTSGYRCPALNKVIGGSAFSQHQLGQAADIIVPSKDLQEVFDYIKNNLPFDQLLYEHAKGGVTWLHVSYKSKGNRKQAISNYKA